MTDKQLNGTGVENRGGLSAVGQSAAGGTVARCDANVGAVSHFTDATNSKRGVTKMDYNDSLKLKRIDFGGRVSGEVLTLLGYAVQQSFYEKFEELEIKHARLAMGGKTDRVTEIVEEYMNEPFFDGAYPQEKEGKPVDMLAWAEGLGRQIILVYDDAAVADITKSLANLRGECRPCDKTAIQDWLRSCGRAVRELAATKPTKWVRGLIDEFYFETVDCGLTLKIRTSIICILIGLELLREVLWNERGMRLFEIVGKTFGEYKDWLIEQQMAVQ